jgi:hypothetical protein
MKSEASLLVSLGIAGLALALVAAFVGVIRQTAQPSHRFRSTLLATAAAFVWLAVPGLLAARGVLLNFEHRPPPALVMLVVLTVATTGIAFSSLGKRVAIGVPLWALVAVQGFRFPLELFMHRAALEGAMPVQMSFAGSNYDIVTGITALVLGAALYFHRVSPTWVIAWNVVGFALLVNIVTIALLSMPLVQFWGPDQVNTFALRFPYVWLPAILVQAALMGHLLILRRLLSGRALEHSVVDPATASR